MKKYILKYKLLNLIHIILIGFSSAFLVGASVTLSIMLNKLVESDFKGFLIWLGIEFGVYLLFLADTYLIRVNQTKLIQKMTLSLRDDYINSLTRKSFSEFKNKTVLHIIYRSKHMSASTKTCLEIPHTNLRIVN